MTKTIKLALPLLTALFLLPLAAWHANAETQPVAAPPPAAAPTSQARPVPPFQTGDRWCVLGDSITAGGLYHHYIELFYLTRFPSVRFDVINCGIAGDTATGAEKRLAWDCLDAKPTVVTVMFGMNDVNRYLYEPAAAAKPDIAQKRASSAETYDKTMRRLTQKLRDSGAKVVCLLPTPYDDTADLQTANLPGCTAALAGLGNRVRTMADELQFPVVDFTTPLAAINSEKQKLDPHYTIIGTDRVHPKEPGSLIMAATFLKAQQLTGVVSRMEIDAAAKSTSAQENCRVCDLKVTPEGVTFTSQEQSLPFPVADAAKPALDLIPFTQDFNQETLRVTGLAPGSYELKIDGQAVRTCTEAELAGGVNLAMEPRAPQYQQALAVQAALGKKWEVIEKMRTIAYVEFGSIPDAPRPLDVALVLPKLDAKLASAAGQSWEGFIRAQQQKYRDYKPHEAEYPAQMEEALLTARQAAVLKPRAFSLSRVVPTPGSPTAEETRQRAEELKSLKWPYPSATGIWGPTAW